MEYITREEVHALLEGETSVHVRRFDCPICKHQTLSESRQVRIDGSLKTHRFCFGCGNLFGTSWKKVKTEDEE